MFDIHAILSASVWKPESYEITVFLLQLEFSTYLALKIRSLSSCLGLSHKEDHRSVRNVYML